MENRKQPESLRLRTVTASFTVDDVEASLAFYREVLGFTVHETFEDGGKLVGVALKAGDAQLFLGQDDFAKGRGRTKGVGVRLWCTTVQDLEELAVGIEARGGELAQPLQDRPWGSRDFGVVDPDGYQLSFTTPGMT